MGPQLLEQTALVTGAGSGLGREIAIAFASEGARVLATDVDTTSAAATADACNALMPGSASCACDV